MTPEEMQKRYTAMCLTLAHVKGMLEASLEYSAGLKDIIITAAKNPEVPAGISVRMGLEGIVRAQEFRSKVDALESIHCKAMGCGSADPLVVAKIIAEHITEEKKQEPADPTDAALAELRKVLEGK